jgi:hypothetical protein
MTAVLVLGASGALGSAICEHLEGSGTAVLRASRSRATTGWITTDAPGWWDALHGIDLGGVVWAGGANAGNTLGEGMEPFRSLLEANLTYPASTLDDLLAHGCLGPGASLVFLSSVWEGLARPGKSAYITSKAALGGLVRAAAAELGPRGIRVNGVLPGVLDTPMTRSNLTPTQISAVVAGTPLGRLVTPEEVARAVAWLVGPGSSGISGTSIPVDGGWSRSRDL